MAARGLGIGELLGMRNAELKQLLVELGLPSSGNKATMVQRLTNYFESSLVDRFTMAEQSGLRLDYDQEISRLEQHLESTALSNRPITDEILKLEQEIADLTRALQHPTPSRSSESPCTIHNHNSTIITSPAEQFPAQPSHRSMMSGPPRVSHVSHSAVHQSSHSHASSDNSGMFQDLARRSGAVITRPNVQQESLVTERPGCDRHADAHLVAGFSDECLPRSFERTLRLGQVLSTVPDIIEAGAHNFNDIVTTQQPQRACGNGSSLTLGADMGRRQQVGTAYDISKTNRRSLEVNANVPGANPLPHAVDNALGVGQGSGLGLGADMDVGVHVGVFGATEPGSSDVRYLSRAYNTRSSRGQVFDKQTAPVSSQQSIVAGYPRVVQSFEPLPCTYSGGNTECLSPQSCDRNLSVRPMSSSLNDYCNSQSAMGRGVPVSGGLNVASVSDKQPENISGLIETLAQSFTLARLPVIEPPVFQGDILRYNEWNKAFLNLVEGKGLSDNDKLFYLQKYTAGEAHEVLSGYFLLGSSQAYQKAKAVLDDRYGSPFQVAEAFKKKLSGWPRIPARDGRALRKLSDFLLQCRAAMVDIPHLRSLNDSSENRKIVQLLPDWLISSWNRKVVDYFHENNGYFPSFDIFVQFLKHEATVACFPVTSTESFRSDSQTSRGQTRGMQTHPVSAAKAEKPEIFEISAESFRPGSQIGRVPTDDMQAHPVSAARAEKPEILEIKCSMCSDQHKLYQCPRFASLSINQRNQAVKKYGCCFLCLDSNHLIRDCSLRSKLKCRVCGQLHNTLLHRGSGHQQSNQDRKPNLDEKTFCGNLHSRKGKGLSSMTVPVYVSSIHCPDHEILCYAMLDTQSAVTFVVSEVADSLVKPKSKVDLCLSTMTAQNKIVQCGKYSGLRVRGYNSDRYISLNSCYGMDNIPSCGQFLGPDSVADWAHLQRVSQFLPPIQECSIGLLIGYDCPEAIAPIDSVIGVGNQPYAVQTALGWSVVGPVSESARGCLTSHRILAMEVARERQPVLTHSSMSFSDKLSCRSKIYISHKISAREITPQDVLNRLEGGLAFYNDDDDVHMSQDDRQFMKTMKNEVMQEEDDHYSMPLPFITGVPPLLPNNRIQALRRFQSLQKRLDQDPVLLSKYTEFIEGMLARGEAEIVPENELRSQTVWYLPHHGVFHPKKPDKLRVVFDASAVCKDQSLNQCLLQGPDLNNTLIGVLTRFREREVAVACDIEKMFYQFKVHRHHRDYLRFLWFNFNGEIVDYRMTVHIFGASSSPGCAMFGLKQIALDHGSSVPHAAEFVSKSFYVDDGLTSCDSAIEAVELLKDTSSVFACGRLRLHKIMSNNPKVLKAFLVEDCATDLEVFSCKGETKSVESALGISWSPVFDSFSFSLDIESQEFTRRKILKVVATIFDPLGFLSPVVLIGKLILQRICHSHDWDDPLSPDIQKEWVSWLSDIKSLPDFRYPRCVKPPAFGLPTLVQVHTFSDASIVGYGACSYIRVQNSEGHTWCSLLIGKARVVPKRGATIPRLELQAAVLAARMGSQIVKELTYKNVQQFFWSDSKIVLAYLLNTSKRFHVFVANRVSLIRKITDIGNWNYVPSESNPADHASRGMSMSRLKESTWINGPPFLWNGCVTFTDFNAEVPDEDPEVRSDIQPVSSHLCDQGEDLFVGLLKRIDKFSSWSSAIRFVALVSHVVKSRFKVRFSFSLETLVAAETELLKLVQSQYFSSELTRLQDGAALPKNSPLTSLNPFVDSSGILRVGGRLRASSLSEIEKHPVILPRRSHVTSLLVRHCHVKCAHQGREMTMAAVRSAGFWVINLNSVVSSLIHFCVSCRKLRRPVETQRMSDLPVDRTDPAPPFTFVGLDCFGPFEVRDGRRTLKRYGLIFTCTLSRAIHVELLDDMSTDSFISSLRCFMALRGAVRQIRCDRGTNFVGAANELARSFKEVDHIELKQFLLANSCEFIFNSPGSSHMGGVWERQIRTFRNVLNGVMLQAHSLDVCSARTLMYEAMTIVNSRPLTTVDPDSLIPLAPNDILHMKSSIVLPPPGKFESADAYSRKRWRRVQQLADCFWNRWKRSYLVNLQNRQCWSKLRRNMRVNDVVLILDENAFRGQWKLARVTELITSKDGLVRRVKVFVGVSKVVLERPIHKLVLLVEAQD